MSNFQVLFRLANLIVPFADAAVSVISQPAGMKTATSSVFLPVLPAVLLLAIASAQRVPWLPQQLPLVVFASSSAVWTATNITLQLVSSSFYGGSAFTYFSLPSSFGTRLNITVFPTLWPLMRSNTTNATTQRTFLWSVTLLCSCELPIIAYLFFSL